MIKAVKAGYAKFFSAERSVFLRFSLSTFIRTFSLAISGLIIMTWIKPEEMGIYNSYNILIAYSFFLQLGIFNGLNRQIPFLLGQGKEDEVLKLATASLSFAKLLSFSFFILGLIVFAVLWFFGDLPLKESKMLLVIVILTAISFYQNYLNVTYRSQKHFKVLSKINNISSLLIFVSLAMVYFFAYDGLVLYYLFNGIFFLLLTHFYRPYKINAKFSFPELKKLVAIGMPIFALGYLQQISKTFNRLILVAIGSVYLVGLFSPASAIYSAITFLPSTIAQFLYPKFSYLYGKHNDKKMLIPYVNKIYLLSAVLMIPTLLFCYFALPWAFERFVPKYVAGTFAAQIFLICGVINITSITINIFYSIGNKKSVTFYTFIKLILMFCLPLACTFFMKPLEAVSIGTLAASICTAALGYILLIKTLNGNHR